MTYRQTLAFPTLAPHETHGPAQSYLEWLAHKGYVAAPGIEKDAEILYAPGPALSDHYLGMDSGLVIVQQRNVFHSDGGFTLICPRCGWDNAREGEYAWGDAVDEWFAGNDDASHMCDGCGYEARIVDWPFDPEWAFAHLGFEFRGWPSLTRNFIAQAEKLVGAPARLVHFND